MISNKRKKRLVFAIYAAGLYNDSVEEKTWNGVIYNNFLRSWDEVFFVWLKQSQFQS